MTERRQRLALEVSSTGSGRFEILAITAGAANGWEFPAQVLRESLALWDGVNCFWITVSKPAPCGISPACCANQSGMTSLKGYARN